MSLIILNLNVFSILNPTSKIHIFECNYCNNIYAIFLGCLDPPLFSYLGQLKRQRPDDTMHSWQNNIVCFNCVTLCCFFFCFLNVGGDDWR